MRSTWIIALAGVCGAGVMAGVGCSDDETGETNNTTTTTTTTSAQGGSGGSGDGGAGGSGGGCHSCAELVQQNLPPTAACPGAAADAIMPLITCLCTECGYPGTGGAGGAGGAGEPGPCFPACSAGDTPTADCLTCDGEVSAPGEPCEAVMAECLAN